MSQKTAIRIVATGARLLIGIAVVVGCVAAVVAGIALPWPSIANEPAQVQVVPTAGDTTLVCTGAFRAVGRNPLDAVQQFPAAASDLTVGGNGAREESALAVPELADTAGPQVYVAGAERGAAAPVVAAESVVLAADDLSGLAAAPCRETRTESWLVGGSVETGTNDLIILSNPGDVTATAKLTVFGFEQTASTVLVPAGTQLSVPLSSIAAGAQDPVVRVTAAGAPLRAVLQSSLIRTLDPAGIDLQDSTPAPASELVFSGVQVLSADSGSALTVLRLMATEQATEVEVTVRSGGVEALRMTVPLESTTAAEVNLDGLPPGLYSVEVRGDAPLVGAVRQATGTGPGSDFAWMTPAPELNAEVLFAVPQGPAPRLQVVNSAAAAASVSLTPLDGTPTEITVEPGADAVIDLAPGTIYSIAADETIRAAVIQTGTDQVAGWPLWPGAAAKEPITVYP